jgi:hypothetical protein
MLLADAFGAGDGRQLDGVGGGTSTTSKAAIITPTPQGPADLDYLFAQVGIGDPVVELGSNCGNCATAIALYAVQSGIVAPDAGTTRVRMRNLNTGAVLSGMISTPGGRIPTSGHATVPGSSALGVAVSLSFHAPWGQTTGSVLPTGSPAEELTVSGIGFTASMIDAGAPAAFIPAEAVGIDLSSMTGPISEHLPRLIQARSAAAVAMGIRKPEDPPQNAVPKVGVVAPAGDYISADGTRISAESHDLRVRMLSMLAPHPAIGLTSAVAVALASATSGTVVAEALLPAHTAPSAPRLLRIGTPAGVITAEVITDGFGNVSEVALHRAARQLAVADIDVAQPVAQTA